MSGSFDMTRLLIDKRAGYGLIAVALRRTLEQIRALPARDR